MIIGETNDGRFGLFSENGGLLFVERTLAPVVAEFCRRWGLSKESEQCILHYHRKKALSQITGGAYGKGHP